MFKVEFHQFFFRGGGGWGDIRNIPRCRRYDLNLKNKEKIFDEIMSQSIPTGYIPPGNPRGLTQKTCPGGRDLTFESCPGAGNSTRTGILWKTKVKLQKNSVDQFLQVKTRKQAEFFTFFEVYVFSQWNFSWSMDQFFGSAITHTLQKI